MGGLGSGRQPWRRSVDESRELEIGELADGDRLASQPRGEICWVDERSGEIRACLSYAISTGCWAATARTSILALRYRQTPSSPESRECMLLLCGAGGRWVAECPRCGRPVRQLYSPPAADYFLCRGCYGLVYRRQPKTEALAQVRAAMGSLLDGLYELPATPEARTAAARRRAREALLRMLADELPLSAQELRIYCLRLRKLGLSLRQIAALVDCSKSSVARYLAAGLDGVDIEALVSEWLERFAAFPALAAGDDATALRAQLKMIRRHARLFGLYRATASEPEERVLIAGRADEEAGTASEGPISPEPDVLSPGAQVRETYGRRSRQWSTVSDCVAESRVLGGCNAGLCSAVPDHAEESCQQNVSKGPVAR